MADAVEEDLPALFWDELPKKPDEHPDFAALAALQDEATPLENAENFKSQGNERIKLGNKIKNRFYYHEAIRYYTKGLEMDCGDKDLISVLYGNRAQAELLLGNWRRALNDAQKAVEMDMNNLKAYYRGARAAIKLDEASVAAQMAKGGLALDPMNTDLKKLLEDAEWRQDRKQNEEERRQNRRKEMAKLAAAISTRGIRISDPEVRAGGSMPYLDDEGQLHFPVLFIYPETMQRDIIQDVCENDVMADHLNVMFAEDAEPLEWDIKHEYQRSNIELYYLANAGSPLGQDQLVAAFKGEFTAASRGSAVLQYGKDSASWVKVDEHRSLLQILQRANHVVTGVPMFFIVAKGTEYKDRFLKYGIDSL